MKSKGIAAVSLLTIVILATASLQAQSSSPGKIRWERERISRGMVWKHAHISFEDTLMQNINLLIVNTRKREISIVYDHTKNIPVSMQAESCGAMAAINGGFFNIRDGGSVSYIRTGGLIVDSDTASKWKRNANLNGAIAINKGGEVTVMKDAGNQWFDSQTGFTDVLVTGPLLIEKGIPAPLPPTSLVTTRHPRSALGKSGRHKVILITVDGRTRESAGLSLNELTELMLSLKCSDALNLDGGGSTTLWVSGMPFDGVVNMPCDNRKFDHEGARAVSSILVVK